MTASVAYRWAGAMILFRHLIGVISHSVMDEPTDPLTDQSTRNYYLRMGRTIKLLDMNMN